MSALRQPSPNGPNGQPGRDQRGRFIVGWRGGPGNPLGAKTARLRSALIAAVSEEDIRAIATKLIEQAKAGDLRAIDSLLDRLLGKAAPADLQERVERLEAALFEREMTT